MLFSLTSKWQVLKVGMFVFQPLYEVKLKASKFEDITAKLNIGKLVGVASLPRSLYYFAHARL